jgi:5-methylcytosine-specific restriction endonuclease McrA
MSNPLFNKRRSAAKRQADKCFYCGLPMWETDPATFAARFNLSKAQAALLQCTAEHLHARCDGGGDQPSNIVAACRFCNRARHAAARPLPPARYQARVRSRMSKGRWLAGMLPSSILRVLEQ